MGLASPIWNRRRYGKGKAMRKASAAFFSASNYNSDYDALPNLSNMTGDAVFGANLYPTVARVYGGVGYLSGTGGNYFSTPDAAALDIAGDVTLVWRGALSDYTYATKDGFLVGKWIGSTGARAYALWIMSSGSGSVLRMGTSADGTTSLLALSTVAPPVTDGALVWFKAWRDVDNGAGGHTTRFFYSLTDTNNPEEVVWTQLGADVVTAGTTSIINNATAFTLGANGGGTGDVTVSGKHFYAAAYNGIDGTKVVEFNPSSVPNYAYGWRSSTGEDWLVNVSTAYDETARYKVAPAQLGSAGFYTNVRIWGGESFHTGAAGNYWTTPHTASWVNSTDEHIAYIEPTDWTPASYNIIAAKRSGLSICEGQFFINNASTGTLGYFYDVGGSSRTYFSTVATGFQDGTGAWLRVTRTQNGGNQDVEFFTSRESPSTNPDLVNWTKLGATVTLASANPSANTAATFIGYDATSNYFNGQIRRYIRKSTIGGTVVIDFNPALVADMATTFVGGAGETYTVVKSAVSDTNDPTRLVWNGVNYTYLPGVAGNTINTPNFSTAGDDFEIIFDGQLSTWSPTIGYLVAKNDAAAVFRLDITNTGGGSIQAQFSTNGGTFDIQSTVVVHGIAANQRVALRFRRVASTGLITIEKADRYDSASWTTLLSETKATGVLSTASSAVHISGRNMAGAGNLPEGIVNYVSVVANGDTRIYNSALTGQASYTDAAGTVWTNNRSATGKKLACVDRTVLLFGSDDYTATASHPLLNATANTSFSIIGASRAFGAQASAYAGYLSKGGAAGTVGYGVFTNIVSQQTYLEISDGTNTVSSQLGLTSPAAGATWVGGGVRDTIADTITSISNSAFGTPITDSTTGTLSNNLTLSAGRRSSGGATYWEGEYFGDAFFYNKVITVTELAKFKTETGAY